MITKLLILTIVWDMIVSYVLFSRHIANVEKKKDIPQVVIVSKVPQIKKEDSRIKKLQALLLKYKSPLVENAEDFVLSADKNGLDWKLLVSVGCVESSCGKHYLYNAFGWGRGKIDFGNNRMDIFGISNKISLLHYYKKYRETKNLSDFSLAYNRNEAESYEKKLRFFYEQL